MEAMRDAGSERQQKSRGAHTKRLLVAFELSDLRRGQIYLLLAPELCIMRQQGRSCSGAMHCITSHKEPRKLAIFQDLGLDIKRA